MSPDERSRSQRNDGGQRVVTSKAHHTVPEFFLRGFTSDDDRLTVIHLRPETRVLHRQSPRNVGVVNHLNSLRSKDGGWDDALEKGPTARLDDASAVVLRKLSEFANRVEPRGVLRLLGWTVEERVPLYLLTAGLMTRGPQFRKSLDEQALPTLVAEMKSRLEQVERDHASDPEVVRVIRDALDRPGGVTLTAPENKHQAALVPIIEAVTGALGSTLIAAVRRVDEPLITGSEPVVIFPDGDVTHGSSFARFLMSGDTRIRLWDPEPAMLNELSEALSGGGLGVRGGSSHARSHDEP